MLRFSIQNISKSVSSVKLLATSGVFLNRSYSLLVRSSCVDVLHDHNVSYSWNCFIRPLKLKSSLRLYAPIEFLIDLMHKGEVQQVLDIVNDTVVPYKSTEYAQLIKNAVDSQTINSLFQSAKHHNIYMDYTMCASALDTYLVLKDYKSAELLFNEYQSISNSSYNSYLCNTMLKIYDKTNMCSNALDLVSHICDSGQCPSTTSYTILLFLLLRNQRWDDVTKTLILMKQMSILLPASLSSQILDYFYKYNHSIPQEIYSVLHVDNSGNTLDSYIKQLNYSIHKGKDEDILTLYNKMKANNINIKDASLLLNIENSLYNIYKGTPLPAPYSSDSNDLLFQLYTIHMMCKTNQWEDAFQSIQNKKYHEIQLFSTLYLSQFFSSFNSANDTYNIILENIKKTMLSPSLTLSNYEYLFTMCSNSRNSHVSDVLPFYQYMKEQSLQPSISILNSLFSICTNHKVSSTIIDTIYKDLFKYNIKREKSLYMKILPLFFEPTMTVFTNVLQDMKKDDIHIDSDITHLVFQGFIQYKKFSEGIQYYIHNNREIDTTLQIKLDIMQCSLYDHDQKLLLATVNNISQSPYENEYTTIYKEFKTVLDELYNRKYMDTIPILFDTITKSYMNTHSIMSFSKYIIKTYEPTLINPSLRSLLWSNYINNNIHVKLNNTLIDTSLYINILHICPDIEKNMPFILKDIQSKFTKNPPASLIPMILSYYIEHNMCKELTYFSYYYLQQFHQISEQSLLHLLSQSLSQNVYSSNKNSKNNQSGRSLSCDDLIELLLKESSPQVLTNTVLSYIGSYYAYTSQNDKLNNFISKYPSVNINMFIFKNYTSSLNNNKNINYENSTNYKRKDRYNNTQANSNKGYKRNIKNQTSYKTVSRDKF